MTKTFVLAIFASASFSVYAQTDSIPPKPDTLNVIPDSTKKDAAFKKTATHKKMRTINNNSSLMPASANITATKVETVIIEEKSEAKIST